MIWKARELTGSGKRTANETCATNTIPEAAKPTKLNCSERKRGGENSVVQARREGGRGALRVMQDQAPTLELMRKSYYEGHAGELILQRRVRCLANQIGLDLAPLRA